MSIWFLLNITSVMAKIEYMATEKNNGIDKTLYLKAEEKEILIKNIELINELKQNNEKSSANQK